MLNFVLTRFLEFALIIYAYGEGNGHPLQCSCLENPRDWGAWWAAVSGVTQGQIRLKRLSSSSRLQSEGAGGSTTRKKEKRRTHTRALPYSSPQKQVTRSSLLNIKRQGSRPILEATFQTVYRNFGFLSLVKITDTVLLQL